MVTRSEVVRRAASLWPTGTVPYDQGSLHRNGYRQDCSGFVSMCWGIPAAAAPGGWGGLNTVTLVTGGWMREIPASDLKPGDAVGICGPNTAGDDGHIVLFEKWVNDNPDDDHYWCYEQAGGARGPLHRIHDYPYSGSGGPWKAWRFRDITDAPAPAPPGPAPTPTPGGKPMPSQYDGIKDVVLMNGPPGGTRLGDVWGRTLGTAESAKAAAQAAQAGVAQLLERAPAGGTVDPAAIVAQILPHLPTADQIAAALIRQLKG